MKIKRFEAPSMSDALRMIKKEFGEEAVILSAKNLSKTSRLFGKRDGAKVIVTAAIDEELREQESSESVEGKLWNLPDFSSESASSSRDIVEERSTILDRYTPITRTGQQKLRPKLVRLKSEARRLENPVVESNPISIYPLLREQGLNEEVAAELATIASKTMSPADGEQDSVDALTQAIQTKEWIVPGSALRQKERSIIVLVGPNGSGKTATAAKLAARALLDEQRTVGIISLDNQRVAGTDELSRFAGIMGLNFETATEPQQLSDVMGRMAEAELIVIDTPGIGYGDHEGRQFLEEMIGVISAPEVHLLLNASSQEKAVSKMIRFFRSVGVNRVLPTHLDWADQIGPFVNQMSQHRLPMSYLGTGARIPEDLCIATSRILAMRLLSIEATDEVMTDGQDAITVVKRRSEGNEGAQQFVANQNSDIFHRIDCKAVKRINNTNALVFNDSNEALAQGFKPCRMCCSEHIVLKPIDRLARTRYAGSRI